MVPQGELKTAIEALVKQKSEGAELSYEDRIPVISEFIEKELARLEENNKQYENNAVPIDILNDLFRRSFSEVWKIRLE